MSTLAESYICHVGGILEQLAQDKSLAHALSADLSNSLSLNFVDASTPEYIRNVDVSFQRVVQKMIGVEQELSRHRSTSPADTTILSSTPGTETSSVPIPTPVTFGHSSAQETRPIETTDDNDINHVKHSSTVPCNECIQKCAVVASNVVKGNFSILMDCHNGSCNEAALVVSTNEMVSKLSMFTNEVIRVTTQGIEGNLGVQSKLEDEDGAWKDVLQHLDTLMDGHSKLVQDVVSVCSTVTRGEIGMFYPPLVHLVDFKGDTTILKNTMDSMVEHVGMVSAEIYKVTCEYGIQGVLGGRVEFNGASGIWEASQDNINTILLNMTAQVRGIAEILVAVGTGDLSRTLDISTPKGEFSDLKLTLNGMVERLQNFTTEIGRVAHQVGTEGSLGGQADARGAEGSWRGLIDQVNAMAAIFTANNRDIANVCVGIARGDLFKRITVDVSGELLDLKHTINIMVQRIQDVVTELVRVGLDVGTEGKLGGQAHIQHITGSWKELTDVTNTMAANMTTQVRAVTEVAYAVAHGDLSKTIENDAQREMMELKMAVNSMVEQLRTVVSEITRVAREVGTEGKLEVGQVVVKDVEGAWKELVDSINAMIPTLTAQGQPITDVTGAATAGDK